MTVRTFSLKCQNNHHLSDGARKTSSALTSSRPSLVAWTTIHLSSLNDDLSCVSLWMCTTCTKTVTSSDSMISRVAQNLNMAKMAPIGWFFTCNHVEVYSKSAASQRTGTKLDGDVAFVPWKTLLLLLLFSMLLALLAWVLLKGVIVYRCRNSDCTNCQC